MYLTVLEWGDYGSSYVNLTIQSIISSLQGSLSKRSI